MNKVGKNIYRVARSLLFSASIVAVSILALLYVLLSVPAVRDKIRTTVESEVSDFLQASLTIRDVDIRPFNEVKLKDVLLLDQQGDTCVNISTVGAGISLWKLLARQKIEITYAEIIGLDARISQSREGGELNIQFLIDAFSPKDKSKPPTSFDLALRSIVIRKSRATFDRLWTPPASGTSIDFNHVAISDLKADIAIPTLKNDDFHFDVRRLALKEQSGLTIDALSFVAALSDKSLNLSKFTLRLPSSLIHLSEFHLDYDSMKRIPDALKVGNHRLRVLDSYLTPSDFSAFFPPLKELNERLDFSLLADGNLENLKTVLSNISSEDESLSLSLDGSVENFLNPSKSSFNVKSLLLNASPIWIERACQLSGSWDKALEWLRPLGEVELQVSGSGHLGRKIAETNLEFSSDLGLISLSASASDWSANGLSASADIDIQDVNLKELPGLEKLGFVSGRVSCDLRGPWKNPEGRADVEISRFDYLATSFDSISVVATKVGEDVKADFLVLDQNVNLQGKADMRIAPKDLGIVADVSVNRLVPSALGVTGKYSDYSLSGNANLSFQGEKPLLAVGDAILTDVRLASSGGDSRPLTIHSLNVSVAPGDEGGNEGRFGKSVWRDIKIDSDLLDLSLNGCFNPQDIKDYKQVWAKLNLVLHQDDEFYQFFNLPVRPLRNISLGGDFDGAAMKGSLSLDAPYILQGKYKLIRDTKLKASYDEASGVQALVSSIIPAKNDDLALSVKAAGEGETLHGELRWSTTPAVNSGPSGHLDTSGGLNVWVSKAHDPMGLQSSSKDLNINIARSGFTLGGRDWRIGESKIEIRKDVISVSPLLIGNGLQSINISGTVGKNPLDILTAELVGIDLKYIFDILNINYVTFGGLATGRAMASGILGKDFSARTENLVVENLSYNNAVIGRGNLLGTWDNGAKKVGIGAVISNPDGSGVSVDGGVYVGRDSLAFAFDAHKVNAALIQPFLKAFTSEVRGKASGKLKLFGTFQDVDLIGDVYADSVSMKVDFTNVTYTATDSVIMRPGLIHIPGLRATDKYGNSATLTGEVKHHYFHDADFRFNIVDAKNLLCFDTDEKINPVWYGKIFASGKASISGHPGIVRLDATMATDNGSDFTFVLEDTQTASDYAFLTFSDKRKESIIEERGTQTLSLEEFYRQKSSNDGLDENSDLFLLNLNASVNPGAKVNIVMDPVAGDKISAEGKGGLRMSYSSASDELQLFGSYNITDGYYNFSLQDVFLRGFKIEPGSSISFTGDPLAGVMDITAAYRVNTSLADLDKSFAADPELNRTSVPVDALLKVHGPLTAPEIGFDVTLPTVSQEVERKVRSIISSEDMLQRQVLYLLALNRFYTPEYAGGTGGEFASVASATLSSQLSNLVGQLSDKVFLNPSFKSDKSDFSDMEVNLALSSRLLDNRLLINGNLGYRDRSVSQTTFVGDFDIEYLLNKDGKLRLKAYNHFNDANYYLRSALTTQGIGIEYRKDFNDPFAFLRRRKKMVLPAKEAPDSLENEKGSEKEVVSSAVD